MSSFSTIAKIYYWTRITVYFFLVSSKFALSGNSVKFRIYSLGTGIWIYIPNNCNVPLTVKSQLGEIRTYILCSQIDPLVEASLRLRFVNPGPEIG